jgi:GNAT superfamily N-acetyltransferase
MPVVAIEDAMGRRVVVRYRRSDARAGPPLSDVVGELVSADAATLVVLGRSGPVEIVRDSVVTARPVAPDRRRILELEGIAARAWPADDAEMLDGWLLRATGGWTRRANSALPLGTSTRPVADQLADTEGFYRARGLRPAIQIPLPARGLLDAELAQRCWVVDGAATVLTRRLPATPEPAGRRSVTEEPSIQLDVRPTDRWQAGYHARDGVLLPAALELLARGGRVRFASVQVDGRTAGIARGVVDSGWLGLSALEVDPAHRRRGLATALMAALEAWGLGEGAAQAYLQVEQANAAALALYLGQGYAEHHRYHFRLAPAPS